VISEGLVGRYYYLQRNWIWLAKQWLPPARFALFWLKHTLRNVFGPLALWFFVEQTHLGRRMTMGLRASVDGLLNRLGERVKTH
jgi:hypothetical protein